MKVNLTPGHRIDILASPVIPPALHGISPRAVFGQSWWDVERHNCYEKASQRCEACGTHRKMAWPNHWLEAHEAYEFQPSGLVVFKDLVCLCPACHKFIHSGLRAVQVSKGQMTELLNMRIQEHGLVLLEKADLVGAWMDRHNWYNGVNWEDFRMEILGKKYGPSSKSYITWSHGEWQNWKPRESE